MDRFAHLHLPFCEPRHVALAVEADAVAAQITADLPHGHGNVDDICVQLVRDLGASGLLKHAVPAAFGGAADEIESRSLCVLRETLAYRHGLADFAFAMQGLGSGAIALEGSDALKRAWLPKVASGAAIAAFALSEPDAGSDVGAMSCAAVRDGDSYVLNGEKTWISNGGIADFYTVFARTGEAPGTRGISAFLVPADVPGLKIAERIEVVAPHPLARLVFEDCRIPADHLLGKPGEGFKLAMRTLDIFRASVAAAALGFGRRALDEALTHAKGRKMFGQTLADFQITQAKLADMATTIEGAALLTYRCAWARDVQKARTTREAAMAKLTATEGAQRVIDDAVQILGGRGVVSGAITESLYREIRSLRIYEGASEVQKLIIARDLLG